MEQDSSSMEKRFAYKFLKKLLKYVNSAQEFIAHLGKSLLSVHINVFECSSTFSLLWTMLPQSSLYLPFDLVISEAMATSGKTDKSPHEQEIKFFAKVRIL